MVNESERRQLQRDLSRAIGDASAGTLMAMLPPFDWSEVARRSDLDSLRTELRGEMDSLRIELRGEMAQLRGAVLGEIGEVRSEIGEVRSEIGEVRGALGEIRGELTGLGHRLDNQLSKLVIANIASLTAATAVLSAIVR